jgi:hypothetical protein
MGTRREPRVAVNLPVRLFGTDINGKPFSENVQTADVSRHGARVEGVQAQLKVGEVLGLNHGASKGRFVVQWVGEPSGPRAGQVGLLNNNPEKWKWETSLPPAYIDNYAGKARAGGERRQHPRIRTSNSVQVQGEGSAAPIWGKTVDISEGGCFVEMPIPLDEGSRVRVTLWLKDRKVWAKGRVVSSRPGFGIGVHFTDMSPQDCQYLTTFLKELMPVRPA